jgi:SOS-response transcriptional repressor LexA
MVVGLNYEKIKKSFQNNSLPDALTFSKIARCFRIDLHWLITGEVLDPAQDIKLNQKFSDFQKLRGWTVEQMSDHLSISPQTLALFKQGQLIFSPDFSHQLCKLIEIQGEDSLEGPKPQPVQIPELRVFQPSNTRDHSKLEPEDYLSIPLTRSSIAAGQPIIQEEDIEDYVLLHIRAAGKRVNMVASRVDGNSMEPMLHSGDIVVIDRSDKQWAKNKIFAIFHENGLTAKYLEHKNHLLILRPINPLCEVQIIDLNEQPDPIVGRIIGAWKEL